MFIFSSAIYSARLFFFLLSLFSSRLLSLWCQSIFGNTKHDVNVMLLECDEPLLMLLYLQYKCFKTKQNKTIL